MASLYPARELTQPLPINTNNLYSEQNGPRRSNITDAATPLSQSGCFEFDRIIKSGYVRKRTGRTKVIFTIGFIIPVPILTFNYAGMEGSLSRTTAEHFIDI